MKLTLLFLALVGASGQDNSRPTVVTSFGKLLGEKPFLKGCEKWLGIPYARAPLGPLRFADPAAWNETFPVSGREASSYSAYCPQVSGGEEDCLYLNVWRPANTKPGAGLAVMVWIHGGAFVMGGSSSEAPGLVPGAFNIYDGCKLTSEHGVIVASMNYRLGPLGFATFEDDNGHGGNFGVKDQRQALVWLQNELNAFGGDPAKVTIFGESAGGISVFYHVASPLSKGLFRGAISESGFPTAEHWPYRQKVTLDWASQLNCSDTAAMRECLRSKDSKDIIAKAGEISNPFTSPGWGPVVDGIDMPEHPLKMFHDGRANAVPFMAGTNTDEGNLFVWPMYEKGMNESQYEKLLQGTFQHHDPVQKLNAAELAEVMAKYPVSAKSDRRALAATMITDSTFRCGTQVAAQAHGSVADMFLYRFNHRSICQAFLSKIVPGIYHSMEMVYVWGDPATEACLFDPEEMGLASRMQLMWTNFAKNLSPMSTSEAFPKYTNSSRLSLVLQTPKDVIESDFRFDYCNLWNDVVFKKLIGLALHADEVVV